MTWLAWVVFSSQVMLGLSVCASQGTCTANGVAGVCVDTSAGCCAGGIATTTLCAGAANIQCCTFPTCSAAAGYGNCQASTTCTGNTATGLCAGPSSITCCVPPSCTTPQGTGKCVDTSICAGTSSPGYCNGPSNVQCCIPNTCITGQGNGVCIDVSQCSGTKVAGVCQGGNNIQCCVTGGTTPTASTPTNPPTNKPPSPAPGSFKGFDLAGTASPTVFSCMKTAGYSYAIVRAWRSSGVADTTACANIKAAHAAGIKSVDIYMFPCPKCSSSAATQVSKMISALATAGCTQVLGTQASNQYGYAWLDIEQSQYWTTTAANQAFFNGMKSQCNSQGINCGVYTSKSQWQEIMTLSFSAGSSMPLWYPHYDNSPSFSDFSAFAGWTAPFIKQYNGDQTVCGYDVDLNWTPKTQPQGIFGSGLDGNSTDPDPVDPATIGTQNTMADSEDASGASAYAISGALVLAIAILL